MEIINGKEISQKIRQELKKEVFGQGAAIDKLLSGLFDVLLFDNSNSSIKASFLFAVPSGTGKTTLANSLAKALNMNTLVVNMAEYSDKDALVRFKGFDKTFRNSRPGLEHLLLIQILILLLYLMKLIKHILILRIYYYNYIMMDILTIRLLKRMYHLKILF